MGDSVVAGGAYTNCNFNYINFDEMKKLLLLTIFAMCGIWSYGQTKLTADSTVKTWNIATLTATTPIYVGKSDTIACYFLKVPAVIEFPLQALGAQWYMGYCVSDYNSWHSSYLYLNKAPVKEQVLISIPKQSK